MRNNSDLIRHLIQRKVLVTPEIMDAFEAVDRIDFVPRRARFKAYGDHPLSIGFGQTISQPYTVAFMLEELQAKPGHQVLDVGSGSGWTTALLAHMVTPTGRVTGVEIVPELVTYGSRNLSKYNYPHAEIIPAAKTLGRKKARFDTILVSAAAEHMPEALIGQLKSGGRMVIPVRSSIFRVDKVSETRIRKTEHSGFAFVPLLDSN